MSIIISKYSAPHKRIFPGRYYGLLYGRSDATLNLQPPEFRHIFEWFERISPEDAVKIYTVTSGVSCYLKLFKGRNVKEDIGVNFFDPTSFLFREAKELLEEGFLVYDLGDFNRSSQQSTRAETFN